MIESAVGTGFSTDSAARDTRGEPAVKEITMAKLFCCDLDQKVMYDCMQIMGGFAYTTEYPIGRAWRDARLNTIGGGASEIMKEIIAKQAKL